MSGNHWLILLCRERVRTQAPRCICGGGWRCRRERYRAAFIEHLKIGGLFYFSLHSDLDHQGQGGHGARSALPVLASSWIQELVHEEQHKLIWCALQQKQLSLPGCQSVCAVGVAFLSLCSKFNLLSQLEGEKTDLFLPLLMKLSSFAALL